MDIEFFETNEGQEAFELIQSHHPKMIILDKNLPKIDYKNLVSEIWTNPKISPAYIILLSDSPEDNNQTFTGPSPNSYILKPFKEAQIKHQIDQGIQALRNPSLVFKDPLTDLGTGFLLFEKIKKIKSDFRDNMQDLSLLLIEIDNFKKLNQEKGSNWKKDISYKFGELLKHETNSDISAQTLGNGLFSFLVKKGGADHCITISEKIKTQLQKNPVSEELITLSMGIKNINLGNDCKFLIPHAQEALLDAKSIGPNNVEIYYSF